MWRVVSRPGVLEACEGLKHAGFQLIPIVRSTTMRL